MPGCGFTIDFLYERLKAAEAEGSEVATQLIDDFLSLGEGGEREAGAEEDQERTMLTRKAEEKGCRKG